MTAQLLDTTARSGDDTLVRKAMRVDAILVGLLGLPVVLASRPIAEWTGILAGWVLGLGVFFLVYGFDVYWLAGRDRVTAGAWATIAANEIFTVAALAVVVLGVWPLTGLGIAAVLGSGVYTAVLAALQWIGLRRLT